MRTQGAPSGRRAEGGGKRRTGLVQSAARVLHIMQRLLYSPAGRSLTDLSAELGLPKATVLRLLRTLIEERAVIRDATHRYYLSPLLWIALAMRFPEARSIRDRLRQILAEVVDATGETAVIAMSDQGSRNMVLTLYELGRNPVRVDPSTRPHAPMHAVAAGKCYLASLSDAEVLEWASHGLVQCTPRTIASAQRLVREVRMVRKRGYAVHRDQFVRGVSGLGVPICDERGAFVCALQLTMPTREMTPENVRRWAPVLRTAAQRLSGLVSESWLSLSRGTDQGSRPLPET